MIGGLALAIAAALAFGAQSFLTPVAAVIGAVLAAIAFWQKIVAGARYLGSAIIGWITLPARIQRDVASIKAQTLPNGGKSLADSIHRLEKGVDAIREKQLENYQFQMNQTTLPVGLGAQSPLAYTGLVLAGGDTAATLKAAAEKTSGVNAAMAYGTDGPVAALGLLVMEDPKGVQPVYAPAPLVREEVLKRYPAIATILSPIFKSLDRPTLQMLNARIQLEGQDPRKVASAYLHSKGFLK